METSAKTSMNVNEIFMAIGKCLRRSTSNMKWNTARDLQSQSLAVVFKHTETSLKYPY